MSDLNHSSKSPFTALEKPIGSVYGVGPALKTAMEKLCGPRLLDALFHIPTGITKRQHVTTLSAEYNQDVITVKAKVIYHKPAGISGSKWGGGQNRGPYRVTCRINDQNLSLVFFRSSAAQLKKLLPENQVVVISGKLELFKGQWQITHPDHIGPTETLKEWIGVSAVYPLTQSLTQKTLHKIQYNVLKHVPHTKEWLSEQTLKWHPQWKPWHTSIKGIHTPKSETDIDPLHPYRERLAYDEMFANQLALQLVRLSHKRQGGLSKQRDENVYQKAKQAIPFDLTKDQEHVLEHIQNDLMSPYVMNRLLQGDVGSGKTVVAFLSAVHVISAGFQVALMAPTEILAKQHFESLAPFCESLGLRYTLLTGKLKKSEKSKIYADLVNGDIDFIIGTHALIQDDVVFHSLGLIIIDEQHRFGVQQRIQLGQKGKHVDVLSMTATPIPRTLMMASYGDLDTSQLREKPAGRKPVNTSMVSLGRITEVIEGLTRSLQKNEKIYWVCPLVEESEKLDLAAAEDRFQALNYCFPGKVGLVHGKLKAAEKEAVMTQFHQGEIKILVATTVIEVGVNDPDACVIVIEHAERFGLAQLHQLRGRVGRSHKQSYCVLLYDQNASKTAQSRLSIMRQTNDGFEIAEEDWRIRGGGEVLGLRQSGLPDFKFVDWQAHQSLLKAAHREAETLLSQDPNLTETPQGQAAFHLLQLFGKHDMVGFVDA